MVDTPIGTNSPNYTLVSGDLGVTVYCRVTATNASGSSNAISNVVGPITAAALPANAGGANLPNIADTTPEVTVAVSCTTGTWTGDPTITYAYQWKCGGTNVGTNSASYTPVVGDIGATLQCVVTATNGAGSANATSNTTGAVAAAPAGETETAVWEAAVIAAGGTVSTSPAGGRKALVNALIAGLKADGVWPLLDRLYILAAENTQSALIDLKAVDPAAVTSGAAAIIFTPDRGYECTAGDDFIDTTFNPTVGTNQFTLNSASLFVYDRTSGSGSGAMQMGARVVSPGVYLSEISLCDSGTTCLMRVNDASGGAANANVQGFWVVSRTDSTTLVHYKNGSVFNASPSAATSAGVPNCSFYICNCNNDGSPLGGADDQIAAAGMGGGLTAGQVAALTTRIETYMDAVGAGVI